MWIFKRARNEDNFKKVKTKLLTKDQQESYEYTKICYISKEKFDDKYVKDKKYWNVIDYYHYTEEYTAAAQSTCNLKYSLREQIPIAFHSGSSYDYHFIIKELAEEFKKQFTCLGKSTKKYITFTLPIEKEVTRIDKNGEGITKNISYISHFIDSARFMASSLSNLVNNLFVRIYKIKCKYRYDDKKCEAWWITYKVWEWFLEYTNFKDGLIEYKCLCCNRNYKQKFYEKLKERFFKYIQIF